MKLLFPIVLLAAVLRLWNLGGVPPSVSMDEASIGYNAYSVIQTGVDEYGDFPLISQRGYDDWRRSTYLFLTAPAIRLFGLTTLSIRLPAVVLSLLTIWAVYHIVLLLFNKRTKYAVSIALLSSFLMAVSPWHMYLSRIGHESNAYVSFAMLGFLFFLQGIHRKTRFLVSMVCFTLSIISYYAGQVFIPLLGVGLLILYWDNLTFALRSDGKFRLSFILVAAGAITVVMMTFSASAIVRFGGTSTFKPEAHYQEYSKRMERRNEAVAKGDIIGRIRNSRSLFPIEVFIGAYTSHFNPKWLFMNSSDEPFKAPHTGLLYLWQLPFILVGIVVFLFCRDLPPRARKIIILWVLTSPVPGSIATQAPHAMRTYPSVFVWQLFTAFGVAYVVVQLKKMRTFGLVAIAAVLVSQSVSFLQNYFIAFPKEQSGSFHFALSKAIPYVLATEPAYKKIVFSNEDNLYQSYMLFLYYSQYDPKLYQKQGGTGSGGYAQTHTFGKYEFRPILKEETLVPGVLYVGNVSDFAPSLEPLARFALLDGTIAIESVALP